MHSTDVALLGGKVGENNNLSLKNIIYLVLLGLFHDIATPIGGDITMKKYPDLKEETNFLTYIQHYPKIGDYLLTTF
ncbi:MAG: HD domain-containing protein [Candidatus Peribacteria bacterium]|jgi:hypothetical protein|nr:HD domain-containing protein [Candidatus Peribacteria bacterium]